MEQIVKDNVIYDKSKKFALKIITLSNRLSCEKKDHIISGQIFKSGTSIGANIAESIYACSSNDFINKLQIAEKEACETAYWLELIFYSNYIKEEEFNSLYEDCRELIKLLTSIIKTTKSH
jgi:four helix bundle protein